MTQSEAHYKRMTETPVEHLIATLAVPSILSMLITNVYNLADTYFVGTLGVSASGAVGVVFTLMTILQALGFMLGHGCGSVISRLLAERDVDTASRYISTSFFAALGLGGVILLFGIPFITPLMRLLGSTKTILPYAREYGIYILISAPLLMASLVLNNVLRYEGKANYGAIGLTLGGVLNMIGDPILIYGFGMGVDGAGLSTAISQAISFTVLLVLFMHHAQCKIGIRYLRRTNLHIIADILTTGFPNLFRQGLMSVSSGILNHAAGVFGDACVSAMAITSRVTSFLVSVALGICQGFQPVAGFNYQVKKYARLRRAFRFTLTLNLIVLAATGCASFAFAPFIVSRFQSSPEVLEIGAPALRFANICLIFSAFNLAPSMLFQTCGKKGRALLLASLRGGICFIPFILTLPPVLGVLGIQLSQPLGDVLMAAISLPVTIHFFHHIPKEDVHVPEDDIA